MAGGGGQGKEGKKETSQAVLPNGNKGTFFVVVFFFFKVAAFWH